MGDLRKVHVLNEFGPYLRLIQAYNIKNFHFSFANWRCILHSVSYAFGATVIHISLPIYFISAIWYLIESGADLRKFVAGFPILISLLQMEVTCVALMMKNRTVNETINQLQRVIDQRKLFAGKLLFGE